MITVLHCFGRMNRGGAETMLMNIFRKIDRSAFRFIFLVHDPHRGSYDDEIEALGGKIYYTGSLGEVGYPAYVKNFKVVLSQMPFIDIVHIHMDWQCGFIAGAAYYAGIRNIIVHSHTCGFNKKGSLTKQLAVGCSKQLIKLYATERFACSDDAAKFLYGGKNAQIVNNAIDVTLHTNCNPSIRLQIRTTLGFSSSDIVMIHVGSFSENKNQKYLVDLLYRLRKMDQSYKLLLVGGGESYLVEVKQYANELGLDQHVCMPGVCNNVPDYLHVGDLFLFPSIREGFGMVAVEAQACGLPCIISDTVPSAVDLGLGLVSFVSLERKEQWIAEIMNKERPDLSTERLDLALKRHGLDINDQVMRIMQLYQKLTQTANA